MMGSSVSIEKINGYLAAMADLNDFAEHGPEFLFLEVEYASSFEESLKNYVESMFPSRSPDLRPVLQKVISLDNWKKSVEQSLMYYFFQVLDQPFNPPLDAISTNIELRSRIGRAAKEVLKMITLFFEDDIENSVQFLVESKKYYASEYVHIAFLKDRRIFILDLHHCD